MPPSNERGASSDGMVRSRIAEIYASESRRILATLTRLLGDLDQAEEALQDAFEIALARWPIDRIPASPRAWLVSTGRFKGIDALRRRTRGQDLVDAAASANPLHEEPEEWDGDLIKDDELRLIFTCCHPSLPVEGRIALALRVVCGLETEEVARAFLISPGAMKRRITRAKARIRELRIPYEIPGSDALGDRLASVLRVIYLVYYEGHAATRGTEHSRRDVALAAVRLARRLDDLLSHPEVTGLLALLLFHESRAQTRTDSDGNPIPLELQDRGRWDAELIGEATSLVQRGVMSGRLGPYLIQALVASVHAWASSVEETNWDLVVRYYDLLGVGGAPSGGGLESRDRDWYARRP